MLILDEVEQQLAYQANIKKTENSEGNCLTLIPNQGKTP